MNRNVYMVLAIIGAVVPYYFFINFGLAEGMSLMNFLSAWGANDAALGAAADLVISSVVFWVFMFSRKEGPKPPLFIVLNLAIGLSCALPAYLYASAKS